jgi:hypothetical protein
MPAVSPQLLAPAVGRAPSPPTPAALRADRWFAACEFFIACTLVWSGLPETVVERIYFGELPLVMLLHYLTLGTAAIACLVGEQLSVSMGLRLALLTGLGLGVYGFAVENEMHFWAIDISQFCGLVLGLTWALERPPIAAARAVRRWSTVAAAMILLNVVGLRLGLFPGAGTGYGAEDYRLYTYAIFASTGFVTSMFPLWFVVSERGTNQRDRRSHELLACGGIAVVVLASFLTATRSMLIAVMLSVAAVLWIRLRGRALFAALAVCGLAAIVLAGDASLDQSVLFERMTSTNLAEEERWEEVLAMFDDLGDGLPFYFGRGFGSRFISPTIVDGVNLAYSPHVGILTFWFKGGLIAFFVFAVVPVLRLIPRLAFGQADPLRAGAAATACVYVAQASMSGGWNFLALFVFGAASTLALSTNSTRSQSAGSGLPQLSPPRLPTQRSAMRRGETIAA